MNITILSVNQSTSMGKNNKPYQILDVAYKNNNFGGKVEGKKITSYSQPAFSALATAQPNTSFDITVEKKNGFNEWTVVSPSAAVGVSVQQPNYDAPVVKTSSVSVRNTYETTEERAIKQVAIARQSSLNVACNILSVGAKKVDVNEVIDVADKLVSFVMNGKDKGGATGFEEVPNDFEGIN